MNLANAAGPPANSMALSRTGSHGCLVAIPKLKHCFTSKVKHCLIPTGSLGVDNQFMLDDDESLLDAEELKRRLIQAMDTHSPKITSAELARAFDITPQAVHSWRKTGRISKGRLKKIAAITGCPLEFFLSPKGAATIARAPIEESIAFDRLRKALPDWRNYVLGLAMVSSHEAQALLLSTMRNAVPDAHVEEFISAAPTIEEKK
jgi:transcriptional regulator with XRE-family HTH domain